jgi:Flp pilus assembly protein TadG
MLMRPRTLLDQAARMSAGLLTRMRRDQRGVAAVEFAVVLPFMLMLYISTAAVTQAVSASRDVVVLARTLSDLVAQQSANVNLTDTTAKDIFSASTAIMAPFPTTPLKMTLSNVEFVSDVLALNSNLLDAKVRWTVSFSGGTLRPCTNPLLTPVPNSSTPSPTTMPVGLYAQGFLIVSDVTYTYTPSFGYFNFTFGSTSSTPILSFTMSRTAYMRPRQTNNIRYTAGQSAQICPIAFPQTS